MLVLRSAYASAHTCARPLRARLLGSSLRWAESAWFLIRLQASLSSSLFLRSTSTSFLNHRGVVCALLHALGSCLRASGLVTAAIHAPPQSSPLPGVVSRSLSRPPSFPIPVCPGSSRPYIQFTPRPHRDLFSLLHTLRLSLLPSKHHFRVASTPASAFLSPVQPVLAKEPLIPDTID